MEETRYMISDACRQLDMEPHVLRYWEEELQLDITRNEQGYRCYTQTQLLMFQRIKILRENGYQLKAIRLVVPRLAWLDDDEFDFIAALSEEMNRRAAELPDTMPSIFPTPAANTELARQLRFEQFEELISDQLNAALDRHAQKLTAAICTHLSSHLIKEMNYRFRLQEEELEKHFRRLDEAIRSRQKNSIFTATKKEAAASRFSFTGHRKKR